MKKLLGGLLVLGSISSYAQDFSTNEELIQRCSHGFMQHMTKSSVYTSRLSTLRQKQESAEESSNDRLLKEVELESAKFFNKVSSFSREICTDLIIKD